MRRFLTAVCLMALSAGPAWADATIERYSRSDGFAGMGGFESTSIQTYTEVKSIRTVPADPTRFEVPAGFTLKK